MFTTFMFQLIIFGFIAINILILAKLFPVESRHNKKSKPRKI